MLVKRVQSFGTDRYWGGSLLKVGLIMLKKHTKHTELQLDDHCKKDDFKNQRGKENLFDKRVRTSGGSCYYYLYHIISQETKETENKKEGRHKEHRRGR